MYNKSERFYDAIYSKQDYRGESKLLHGLIQKHKRSQGSDLLDIACGTGQHIPFFQKHYCTEGLDLNGQFLKIAKARNPKVLFHHASMLDFKIPKQFDAIICMFSAIGYVKTVRNLNKCLANMAKHLKPGGVLIIEPWFSPTTWRDGLAHAVFIDQPDLKIARMNIAKRKGSLSIYDPHYLVATKSGVEYFSEYHELGLFTIGEYKSAFSKSALKAQYDSVGPKGRGLYIGCKSL